MRTFSERELSSIDAALIIAAEVYDDDAEKMEKCGQSRTAAQFKAQAAAARKLAEEIGSR